MSTSDTSSAPSPRPRRTHRRRWIAVALAASVATAGAVATTSGADGEPRALTTMPRSEEELFAVIEEHGPNAVAELSNVSRETRLAECEERSGDGDAGPCAEADAAFIERWVVWLEDLARLVPSSGPEPGPSVSCLADQGVVVTEDDLRFAPSSAAIEQLHIKSQTAALLDEQALVVDGVLKGRARTLLESDLLGAERPVALQRALGQLLSKLETWAGSGEVEPGQVEFQGWFDAAGDAAALAEQLQEVGDRDAAGQVRSFSTSVTADLEHDRAVLADAMAEIEVDAPADVERALEACGPVPEPAAPSVEQVVEWLRTHPDAIADLIRA